MAGVPPHDRVIIADDSAMMRGLVRSCLDDSFRNIYLAKDGPEAIEFTRTLNPELIVVDIRMPHRDGVEVCREIRQMPHVAHVPIIAITGDEKNEEAKTNIRQAGANAVLVKPISKEQMMEHVNALLPAPRRHRTGNTNGLVYAREVLNERRRVEAAARLSDQPEPTSTGWPVRSGSSL